jgi:anti-sigma-K factor RskA
VPYQIVDACDIPADRLFRGAWVADEMGHIGVDIDRARAVAHDLRRADRQERLAPLDHLIAAQIPGPDAKAAEAKRASIRAENASQQAQIDAAKNEAALRAALGVV